MPFCSPNYASCYDWLMRALVTGGTGRIGAAITAQLENAGWSVLAAGRADGDVARPEVARTLVDRAATELGGIDLLVNGAAEGFAPKSALELTKADWDSPSARQRRAASSSPKPPPRTCGSRAARW